MRIDPGRPSQGLPTQQVAFTLTLPNQAHFRSIRVHRFLSQLTQWSAYRGECIPVSSAILRACAPNIARRALGVVEIFCSATMRPLSSKTQYQLERSPRSKPIVSFCSRKLLICFAVAVLIFFIVGLPLSVLLRVSRVLRACR